MWLKDKLTEQVSKAQADISAGISSAQEDISAKHQSLKEYMETPSEYEQTLSFSRFVKNHLGYPLEKHVYSTKDGYINTVHRIPGPKGTKSTIHEPHTAPKPVVIYQHGLMDCGSGAICAEEHSIGLRLVEAGFDLWMNHSRGSKFSRDHQEIDLVTGTPEDINTYYEFSFTELGQYDQPALWDYIKNVTGVSQASYIGHSQGTSQMFAALTMNPEFFKDRLQCFFAIAPVVTLSKMNSKLVQDLSREQTVIDACRDLGPHNMYKPSEGRPSDVMQGMILGNAVGKMISQKIMGGLSDKDPETIDKKALDNFMLFFPAGASFRQINHLKQLLHSGTFKHYDFEDETKNLEVYGFSVPPEFDFSKMKGNNFDISLVCGEDDMLASPGDYKPLVDILIENGCKVDLKEYPLGHLGLVMPKDTDSTDYIVNKILSLNSM